MLQRRRGRRETVGTSAFSASAVETAIPRWGDGLPRLQEVIEPGHVAYRLTRLWEEGEVVKVQRRRWAVPVHPDFSPEGWRAFLEEVRQERADRLELGYQ